MLCKQLGRFLCSILRNVKYYYVKHLRYDYLYNCIVSIKSLYSKE